MTNKILSMLYKLGSAAVLALGLAACSTTDIGQAPVVPADARWGLLPFANHTETPQAGLRAESISESILRANGLAELRRYPASLNNETLFEPMDRKQLDAALDWARSENIAYALSGTVDEWRYKVGIDGEPAVGLTLQLIEVSSGKVVWAAAGAKSGWSREALSAVAQKLMRNLLSPLRSLAQSAAAVNAASAGEAARGSAPQADALTSTSAPATPRPLMGENVNERQRPASPPASPPNGSGRPWAASPRPAATAAQKRQKFWSRFFTRFDTDSGSPRKAALRIVETIALVAAALAVAWWLAPEDPFGLQAQFPWLWLMPAILAMRYGSTLGVVAVATMLGGWYLLMHGHQEDEAQAVVSAAQAFPQAYFLGGLVLTLLCGQFAEVWNARSRRLRGVNAYLEERLTMLTKNHFLLRLSHERLEQDLLSKPLTLRESLDRMRALTLTQYLLDPARMPAPDAFLQILVQSCQVESASVFACDVHGHVLPEAVASVGKVTPLVADDPLVRYCLTQQKLGHIQTESLNQTLRNQSRYLVCAPLRNYEGRQFGLLVVEQLPFLALNEDTLQLMSVLIDYYADGIEMGDSARAILQQLPTCPPELAVDLVRLHRLKRSTDIDSSLVALVFGDDELSRDMYDQVRRLKRAADVVWTYKAGGRNVLMTLLPLAGPAAVDGYLMRIETASHAQFDNKSLANFAAAHTAALGSDEPMRLLINLVERCAA